MILTINNNKKKTFLFVHIILRITLLLKGLFSRCFDCRYCITSALLLSDHMVLVDCYKWNGVRLAHLYCAVIDMPVAIQMPSILRRKKRAVRMMATVVLLFAACWAPFHLVSLLLDYGTTKLLVLFRLAYCCQSPCFFFSSPHKK